MVDSATTYDPLIFGANADEGLVSAELVEHKDGADEIALFVRCDDRTEEVREPFRPFIVAELEAIAKLPMEYEATTLAGDAPLNLLATFTRWSDFRKARGWLAKSTRISPGTPNAPYLCLNDPVQQHLMRTGRTQFLGMQFEDLRRMQIDIECYTSEGFEFCNAERPGDRILAIALSDQSGWEEVLFGSDLEEKDLLEAFVRIVRERNPDILEGHNIFNFDLPYIAARARRHGVKLRLGRDGSVPRHRPSRLSMGERTIAYTRFDVFGRHVVDTLFLVHAYDVSHRSLSGLGLKDVAIHFSVARSEDTYIEGHRISEAFDRDPERVRRYVRDDVLETRAISNLLSRSSFVQAQMLPFSYQNVCVRGSATKIDSLMLREYLRCSQSIPIPDQARRFAGGYTDMFIKGIVENVHHCDVRSLYPSLMLTQNLSPREDALGVFLKLLEELRAFRVEAKQKMQRSRGETARLHYDALQAAFKILINSFYGYLGFSQARFNDFDTAETVTSEGRKLLHRMIDWLRKHDATPVEIDTDGIYFVPPPVQGKRALQQFRQDFQESLPEGIEVEFDGEYRSMYSYKMKNYALLTDDGEIVLKGGALRSRGLEPFQREFLEAMLRLHLENREDEIPALKERYEQAIRDREWAIAKLAKTEALRDSPQTYRDKIKRGGRGRSATYELALASGRDYRPGDQVSYYVTGDKKSVTVHESARLATDWDPDNRDENVPYYLGKLDALYKKFAQVDRQQELDLGA